MVNPTFEKLSDVIKILPSVIWSGVCISAIPSYSAISWRMPVVCAVLSGIVSILCTFDIINYHRRYDYIVFGDKKSTNERKTRWSEIKFVCGSLLSLSCFILMFVFLAIGYQIPNPKLSTNGCSYGILLI